MTVLAIMLGGCTSIDGRSAVGVAPPSNERPNVILIMADDMGYECVAANGSETYETPRLDAMAAQGMRFEYCFSQPICTPSRVQIMTGRYNSRNYIRFGFLDKDANTIGHLMKNGGYATAVVGKWQLSDRKPDAWDDPIHFGFDEYCLWQLTRLPGRYPNPGLEINGQAVDYNNGEYGPDIVSDYACSFIEKHKDQPFFLYYPMILPHWPFEPTPDSEEWDPTAKGHSPLRKPKHFREMVTYTDKIVGKIIDKVDTLGLTENTIIIFTCDNGTMRGIESTFQGRTWVGGKGKTTDAGTHVPLIIRWPGKTKEGSVNSDLVDFSDVLPTIADLSGQSIPPDWSIDGNTFAPQLRGQRGNPRQWTYCWYFRNGKPAKTDKHMAGEYARTHDYKLYADGRFYHLPTDQLEEDPLDPSILNAHGRQIKVMLEKVIDDHTRPGFYE